MQTFLFLYSLIYCLRPSLSLPFVVNEKNRKLIGFQQGKRKRFRCLLKHDQYVLEHILIMSSVLGVKTSLTNLCVSQCPLRVYVLVEIIKLLPFFLRLYLIIISFFAMLLSHHPLSFSSFYYY